MKPRGMRTCAVCSADGRHGAGAETWRRSDTAAQRNAGQASIGAAMLPLAEDVARPIIFHDIAAACWQPYVKNVTIAVNSIYNGWRFEDVWMDR